jgi:DNA (cytosine-5)-methyltransferase 1
VEHHRPSFVVVENIVEFKEWGPVGPGGRPLVSKKGATFNAWINAIASLGYRVEYRELNAADLGAATSRNRLFIVARKGNRSPIFPEPTHTRRAGGELPGMALPEWRAAAEVIDWSIPCQSIFMRGRPLADKTLLRIEAGLRRFVQPFVVQWDNHGGNGSYTRDVRGPLGTFTTKANMGLVMPFQVVFHNNQHSAAVADPIGTICTSGAHHGVALPFVVPFRGERDGQTPRTHDPSSPLPTITTEPGAGVAVPFVVPSEGFYRGNAPRSAAEPIPTITSRGAGCIAVPWLGHYYGTDNQSPVTDPVDTITTKPRHSLCVAICRGREDWPTPQTEAMHKLQSTMRELGVADVGFRMLQNHELAAAQGFPASYIFCGNKADVTRQIGNSVSPPVAEAITVALAG